MSPLHHTTDIEAFDDLDLIRARQYLRVSKDRSGRLRSNEEQDADNTAYAERQGWQLGATYEDEGSGSKFKRKRRGDFDRLIADLRANQFDAEVLIVWEPSRGSREVPEWYQLLGLCQVNGVHVHVTNERRTFDPRVARDWKALMDAAVDAEYEVLRASERILRSTKADAGDGVYHGGRRPFGYQPGGMAVDWEEAKLIKAAVKQVTAGVPIRQIARAWNAEGIVTTAGNPWHPNVLRSMLTNARLTGKRVHHGEVVGDAKWPAILTEAEHRRLLAALAHRSPVGRRGRTPWLLTGLLRCGKCGETLVGNADSKTGTRRYVCRKAPGYKGCGGLGIKAEPLEEFIVAAFNTRMDEQARRRADPGTDDSDEQQELDRIAVKRAQAFEDNAEGRYPNRTDYLGELRVLDRRQKAIDKRLAAKVSKSAVLDFTAPWHTIDADEKRRRLHVVIDSVTVDPVISRGSRVFDTSRVQPIEWKV